MTVKFRGNINNRHDNSFPTHRSKAMYMIFDGSRFTKNGKKLRLKSLYLAFYIFPLTAFTLYGNICFVYITPILLESFRFVKLFYYWLYFKLRNDSV